MGIARGTNIVRDGLIYGYDTGYGAADKNTSTRFYPGRPTTNEINFATEDLNNWTSYGSGNDGTFTTEFGTVGLKINNRTSWNGAYKGFTLPSTGTYTFSGWFRYRGGTSSNNGATVYIASYGGSDTATALNKSKIGEWQRVSKTVNVTDVTVTFYFISYGGTTSGGSPDKSSWDVTMPQIEKLSDETPFVNGSRSDTTSLIDLKRTTNIDVSNVSFDSTGQPDFDGTDDYIPLASNLQNGDSAGSWEFVVNFDECHNDDTSTYRQIYIQESSVWIAQYYDNIGIDIHKDNGSWFDGNGGVNTSSQIGPVVKDTWYHSIFTFDQGVIKGYLNGVLGFTTTQSGMSSIKNGSTHRNIGRRSNNLHLNGQLPVFKLYDKALSQAEVTQNYKAYKNRFNI